MIAAPPMPETRSYPVPLVCPQCAQPFDEDNCCQCAGTPQLEWWHGLPRTLFGQNYWGETSQANMHRVLDLLDTMPWRDALRQVVGDEPVYRHLTEEIGTDFVYSMPWDKIQTVLEIGSGMGFMTAPLAKFAKHVIAVEAVPERALFLTQRAKQDGLDNIYPLIASGTAVPFAPESFDLIALNGVFEYIGLWGHGNPQELQQQFLAKIHRLLKPSGYLYIGIETRLGLSNFFGVRDHSGLRFTSLMPRWLADWYCRRRRAAFYGSRIALDGYRTYTYTPRQYAKMLRQAGFASVDVFGVFDGYNRQVAIARLADHQPWKTTRQIVNPPCSLWGAARRLIGNNRATYKTLENEVVVFGCIEPDAGRLFWDGLEGSEAADAITQINTGKKVSVLLFENGQPAAITKAAKNAAAGDRLVREYEVLQRAQAHCGHAVAGLPVRWPKPLGRRRCHELDFFDWEFAAGDSLAKLLLPRFYRPQRFAKLVRQLTQGYVELMAQLTGAEPPCPADAWACLLDRWSAVKLGDARLDERLRSACRNLARRPWSLHALHGDLTFNNVILTPSGQMILIDWENTSSDGLPAIDLLRLMYDAWMDSKVFKPDQAAAFLANVRSVVVEALGELGVAPVDFADLEMLFVAHQHEFDHERKCEVETMLQAFRDPTFRLLK